MSGLTKVLPSGKIFRGDRPEKEFLQHLIATYNTEDIISLLDISPSDLNDILKRVRAQRIEFFKVMLREVQKGFYYYRETGDTYTADSFIFHTGKESKSLNQICKEIKSKNLPFEVLESYYIECSDSFICGVARREDV